MIPGIWGQCWEWIVVVFWFLAGILSNAVVLVPDASDPRKARKEVPTWFRVTFIWLGLLAVVIGVAVFAGFIDSRELPWRFTHPDWFRGWKARFLPW